MPSISRFRAIFPGVVLSAAISIASGGLEWLERAALGAVYVDGLVLAILIGTLVHTLFGLHAAARPGIAFSSRTILEIAIVLLGGTIGFGTIAACGLGLAATVVVVVGLALAISYRIARALGLDEQLATLVACGNSICGNSAIMATAPAIDAPAEDVAASIAFTAALGIVVVLVLPAAVTAFGFTPWQYGVLAGLSVYAVPQVLAATAPIGLASTQIGTVVKLMRVLMLGPVVLVVGLRRGRASGASLPLAALVPWFVVGFVAMMAINSAGLLPGPAVGVLRVVSAQLTVLSMAALGLSVDLRSAFASGGRVLAAGALSILALVTMAGIAASLLGHLGLS